MAKEWVLNILLEEHDFAAFFRYTGGSVSRRGDARHWQDAPGLRGTHEEKSTRMILARIVLPPLALESFTLSGVLLATIGSLFLAYDLLGRENGPLRWFTLVLTGGFVSTLVFVPVAILDAFLGGVFQRFGFNLLIILPLSWGPAQAVDTPAGMKPAQARPPVFSRQGVVRGLLLGYLLGFAFFFAVNHDVIASLLESVPLALSGGIIGGTWCFINWEPAHPTPHLFSRKGFWTGLMAGFVPWLCWGLALSYADLPRYTGLLKGLEYTRFLFFVLFIVGIAALANAVAGSVAQYALWRANQLPHRLLGAFGLVLIVIAFALQAVQPGIDILNQIK